MFIYSRDRVSLRTPVYLRGETRSLIKGMRPHLTMNGLLTFSRIKSYFEIYIPQVRSGR